ncbi:hypothetical protein [Agrobacterium vitis]|uniref:hypothetical protein n=1 Tax=Agrobacterium vitis TaxID=373 RepID=UPI003D269009
MGNFDNNTIHGYNNSYRNSDEQAKRFRSFGKKDGKKLKFSISSPFIDILSTIVLSSPDSFSFKQIQSDTKEVILDHQGHIIPQNYLRPILETIAEQAFAELKSSLLETLKQAFDSGENIPAFAITLDTLQTAIEAANGRAYADLNFGKLTSYIKEQLIEPHISGTLMYFKQKSDDAIERLIADYQKGIKGDPDAETKTQEERGSLVEAQKQNLAMLKTRLIGEYTNKFIENQEIATVAEDAVDQTDATDVKLQKISDALNKLDPAHILGNYFSVIVWNPVNICRAPEDKQRDGTPGENPDFEVIQFILNNVDDPNITLRTEIRPFFAKYRNEIADQAEAVRNFVQQSNSCLDNQPNGFYMFKWNLAVKPSINSKKQK